MNALLVLAALSGAIAVGAGAFGAHGASGAAAEWLKANPQALDKWLAGVTTLDGKPGLPAVKAYLGVH